MSGTAQALHGSGSGLKLTQNLILTEPPMGPRPLLTPNTFGFRAHAARAGCRTSPSGQRLSAPAQVKSFDILVPRHQVIVSDTVTCPLAPASSSESVCWRPQGPVASPGRGREAWGGGARRPDRPGASSRRRRGGAAGPPPGHAPRASRTTRLSPSHRLGRVPGAFSVWLPDRLCGSLVACRSTPPR